MKKPNITQHPCKHCTDLHDLAYCITESGHRHLFYECPKVHKRVYIPVISGLEIPIRKQKSVEKREHLAATQPTLF